MNKKNLKKQLNFTLYLKNDFLEWVENVYEEYDYIIDNKEQIYMYYFLNEDVINKILETNLFINSWDDIMDTYALLAVNTFCSNNKGQCGDQWE